MATRVRGPGGKSVGDSPQGISADPAAPTIGSRRRSANGPGALLAPESRTPDEPRRAPASSAAVGGRGSRIPTARAGAIPRHVAESASVTTSYQMNAWRQCGASGRGSTTRTPPYPRPTRRSYTSFTRIFARTAQSERARPAATPPDWPTPSASSNTRMHGFPWAIPHYPTSSLWRLTC